MIILNWGIWGNVSLFHYFITVKSCIGWCILCPHTVGASLIVILLQWNWEKYLYNSWPHHQKIHPPLYPMVKTPQNKREIKLLEISWWDCKLFCSYSFNINRPKGITQNLESSSSSQLFPCGFHEDYHCIKSQLVIGRTQEEGFLGKQW